MIVGCGEWGFRELPMRQHFEICQRIGFHWLEFGNGGGQPGRLPEAAGPQIDDDPGNLKPLRDGDASLRLDLLQGRINYCHLKDWRREDDGWVACAVGDDDLDYGPILTTMQYDGDPARPRSPYDRVNAL